MNTATLLTLIATFGPDIVPLIQQIVAWTESGKTIVTAADLAQLAAFGANTSAKLLAAEGVVLPAIPQKANG